MKARKYTYNFWKLASSLFMILTLMWLTVSIPFVNAAQQNQLTEKAGAVHTEEDDDNQSSNPYGNNTEEKASTGSSSVNTISEEYLHHSDDLFHAVQIFLSHHSAPAVAEYVAFHGELLCPPPNFS